MSTDIGVCNQEKLGPAYLGDELEARGGFRKIHQGGLAFFFQAVLFIFVVVFCARVSFLINVFNKRPSGPPSRSNSGPMTSPGVQ